LRDYVKLQRNKVCPPENSLASPSDYVDRNRDHSKNSEECFDDLVAIAEENELVATVKEVDRIVFHIHDEVVR